MVGLMEPLTAYNYFKHLSFETAVNRQVAHTNIVILKTS